MYSLDKDVLESALTEVNSWDFSLTIEKLQEKSYAGWSLNRILIAEKGYKQYLAMTKALGGKQLVPNGDIDRFWHEHILDTRRYAKDCNALFGYFLHHYPFFGMRGEVDNSNWINTTKMSNDLWLSAFGENLYSVKLNAQKCPQKCPGGVDEFLDAQKCPQKCPGGVDEFLDAQKCPQKCPGGVDEFLDGWC